MIISLAVTGAVLGLAVHAAMGQLRFFDGVGQLSSLRSQLAQAALIPRALVWSASPGAGDIAVAQDTALELNAVIGSSVVCESADGWIIIPTPVSEGNTLSAFAESPQPDDRIVALFDDSTGTTWINLHVAAAPASGAGCPRYATTNAWTIVLGEQLLLPAGTLLRFLRPVRLSTYHASDGRWYLGARDWNALTHRFNTIQPVAGPVDPPNAAAGVAGFRFEYFDSTGTALTEVVEPRAIAAIGIRARSRSASVVRMQGMTLDGAGRVADSSRVFFAIRNAR
jgi:hypothetical protein